MTFRDNFAAAQARLRHLEDELQESQETVDELKAALAGKKKRKPANEPAAPRLRKLGKVVFKAPPTYFPLFRLWRKAASVVFAQYPKMRRLESKVFMVWLAYKLLYWPLVYLVWRPLYLVFLVFPVLPVAGIILTVASLLLAPWILFSRFRIVDGTEDPYQDLPWLNGQFTDGQAGMFLLFLISFCMPPLLPVYFRLAKYG